MQNAILGAFCNILSTFIKLWFIFKTFICLFLSGPFTQVLLYLSYRWAVNAQKCLSRQSFCCQQAFSSKRTVSMRWFFWAVKTYVKTEGWENICNFTQNFVHINLLLLIYTDYRSRWKLQPKSGFWSLWMALHILSKIGFSMMYWPDSEKTIIFTYVYSEPL